MLPTGGGINVDNSNQSPLNTPYAIAYDVGTGIDTSSLTGTKNSKTTQLAGVNSNVSANILTGSLGVSSKIPGGQKTVRATFNRETRICHMCTEMITKKCVQKGGSYFGLVDNRKTECDPEQRAEDCEDIPM